MPQAPTYVQFALFALVCLGCKRSQSEEPVRIAAASDLTLPFEEIGRAFEKESGKKVSFSFGSTGLLAKQIGAGAPFDLFAAANVSAIDEVIAKNVCDGSTKLPYGRGRIVVWTKKGKVAPVTSLSDLSDARFTRISIANPEHAPYGQAAREALTKAGVWSTVASRIVQGENVRQALQYAESGNTDVAVVALSLVVMDTTNPWTLVDDALHAPIAQTLVVCNGGKNKPGGNEFARYLSRESAQTVMKRFGFLSP